MPADHFDRLGDRNQLVFQSVNSRSAVHRADLRLDFVEPVGQCHQFVVAVGIESIHPVFDAGPARFHAVHAVLAGKAIDHDAQFVEFDLERVGLRRRCLPAELVDAVGQPLQIAADIFRHRLVLRRIGGDAADFGAQRRHLARQSVGDILLQFLAQTDQCLGDLGHGRIRALRFAAILFRAQRLAANRFLSLGRLLACNFRAQRLAAIGLAAQLFAERWGNRQFTTRLDRGLE